MRRGIGDEVAAGRTGEGGELRACTRALVGELIRLEDELSGRGAPASHQPASQQPASQQPASQQSQSDQPHSPQAAGGLATEGGNPRVQADAVQRRLNALLDHYAHSLRETGGGLYFAEADYALSALADELLLHAIDWPGAQLWREFLLERARFGTEAAGDRVFERIDALRAQPDPASSELAGVYLTVLAMGFQGRYRHGEPAGDAPPEPASELAPEPTPDPADSGDAVDPITLRRRQLFQIACLGDPSLGAPQALLIRQAPPLDAGMAGRLPGIRRWTAVLAAVIVGYLLIGQGIWSVTTQPVEAELADWQRFVEDGARADDAAR